MQRLASRFLRRSSLTALVLVAMVGCVTVQQPGVRPQESAAIRYQRVLDSVALAVSLEADEVLTAPRIRLIVPPAALAMDRYVEASFNLSADAYVLVVAVDLDRRIRVLYPESPDESGFAARTSQNRLTRFFAGFGGGSANGYGTYLARYEATQRITPFDGGGVLLAVASDRPLQLDRLVGPDGEWSEEALSRLVYEQNLSGAAHAVGRAVVLTGQDYNADYRTFSGGRSFGAYSYAARSLDGCSFASGISRNNPLADVYDSWFRGSNYAGSAVRFLGYFQRDGRTFARYLQGGCAGTSYYDVPVVSPLPIPPDSARPDTSVQRKRRFPGARQFPSVASDSGGRMVPVRLSPSGARDIGRDRPVIASGIRFRHAEELPREAIRPASGRFTPREAVARVPERAVERQQSPERRLEPRAEGARERTPAKVREVQSTEVREAQPATVRDAPPPPTRDAPTRPVPVHREPAERAPTPGAPAPATP